MDLWLSIIIFITVFYLIITEKVPNSFATMTGGLLMVVLKILSQEDAIGAIGDRLDIIFLLVGMMIVVSIISETGVFQWFAIKVAQIVKGDPFMIIVLSAVVTAICSAFLDNVTTILLMAPISILLATELKLNPFPFVMTEIMAANIGGSATLIGDPTQLIIGGEGKLGFNDFLLNTSPVTVISLIVLIATVYVLYRKDLSVSKELKERVMTLDPSRSLTDIKLLKVSGTIFIMIIAGFIANNFIHEGVMTIALTGAMVLCIITKQSPEKIFKRVEWDTLFFFMGLFIMVQGIQEVKLIDMIGNELVKVTKGNFNSSVLGITWLSAGLTSIIGNVTNAATVSKIVEVMTPTFKGIDTQALWWALSLGSCLGGNFSILASATNVVGVGAAKQAGCNISFVDFLKFSAVIALQTLIVASIYLWFRYL